MQHIELSRPHRPTPMNSQLLSIIIPTYNRDACLEVLLQSLRCELAGLEGQVTVIVGDNASTDRTPDLIRQFACDWADTVVMRHETNVGADENFCRCVQRSETVYFWIIGDDDLPRAGVIRTLLHMLVQVQPDLVYLKSRWSRILDGNGQDHPVTSLDATLMDRDTFGRRVHVWATFISGNLIRRELAPDDALRRFAGTSLVQLGWVFRALRTGRRFIYVETESVFATSGNTGGYSVLRVFGYDFQRITLEVFAGSEELARLGRAIVTRSTIAYLPGLIWALSRNKLGKFDRSESIAAAIGPQMHRSFVYRFLLRPLNSGPDVLGYPLLLCSRLLARFLSIWDLWRAKASGAISKL
jgi:abequosyltransferase